MQPQDPQAPYPPTPVVVPPQPEEQLPTTDDVLQAMSDTNDNEQQASSALTWQASEYIQYEKSTTWFLVPIAIAVVLLLADIFLIRSWTFGVLIVVMTVGIVLFARRSPQVIDYSISSQHIQVGTKRFAVHDFRAFGVVKEGAMHSIQLIPMKRFMPAVTIYFPVEYGEQIVDMLGGMLPMETITPDIVDQLAQRFRF